MISQNHRRLVEVMLPTHLRLLLMLVALPLTACGPMYDTFYTFTPPETASGQQCLMQCEHLKMQCRSMEEMRVDACEERSRWAQERCRDDIYRRKHREPKWHECGSESCTADLERCEASYRSCYQSCGGRVTSETRCVANCDQIQPLK